MTERQEVFKSRNQTPGDTGSISRDAIEGAIESYKKRKDEEMLWDYIERYDTDTLAHMRDQLDLQINTFEGLGKSRPDLNDQLLIVRQAIGVKRQLADEAAMVERSKSEVVADLRRRLAVVDPRTEADLVTQMASSTPGVEIGEPRNERNDFFTEIGPYIRVDGSLVDVGGSSQAQRRAGVEAFRREGRTVELVESLSIDSPQIDTPDEDGYYAAADQQVVAEDDEGVSYDTPDVPLYDVNEKPTTATSLVTPAELLSRASRIDKFNDFRRTYPRVTKLGVGVVAATVLATGAWGVSTVSSASGEAAVHAELKVPKDGLEFPDSCIDLEKPEGAMVKESVSAWMQLDLRNEAGIAYSFKGANDSSRVGTGMIFNDANAYMSVCEGDVPALSVSDTNANEIIANRDHFTTQLVIDANEVNATPVDAKIASEITYPNPADTEWLVGLLQGDKFTATIDNGEAVVADAIVSDTAMFKDFEQKLDTQVTNKIKDSIKDLAKKSKVDESSVSVKLTGSYGVAERLNGTTEVSGVAVVPENIATVFGKTIDIDKIAAEAAK